MAITKKFKVSFDVTLKVDSENEAAMAETILELARRAGSGEELSEREREILIQALTYGPDGVAAFVTKQGIREMVKDMHSDLCASEREMFRFSPATVREVF